MKIFLFIALLLLQNITNAQSNVPAKVSELKLWGIKGKVKKLTSYLFILPKGARANVNDIDTAKSFSRNTVYYDSVGNISRNEFVNGSGPDKTFGVITYHYNAHGYTAESIFTGHSNTLYKRVWHNSRSYTDSIFSADSTLRSVTKTRLDATGKVKTEEYVSKGSIPAEVFLTTFLYDKKNNLIGKTLLNKTHRYSTSYTSLNERFDAYGNPCVTFKFQNPGRTNAMIVYRVFEYDNENPSTERLIECSASPLV